MPCVVTASAKKRGDGVQKLPINFIGSTAALSATIGFVKARIDSTAQNAIKGHATLLSTQFWLDSLHDWHPPEHVMHANSKEYDKIEPTRKQVLDVCRLYQIDYLALNLPYPEQCM